MPQLLSPPGSDLRGHQGGQGVARSGEGHLQKPKCVPAGLQKRGLNSRPKQEILSKAGVVRWSSRPTAIHRVPQIAPTSASRELGASGRVGAHQLQSVPWGAGAPHCDGRKMGTVSR